MTETYLPEDFIEIDSNTPKGLKGQLASHKRYSDPEQDTGFNTDVDKSDGNRRHVGKPLRQTGYFNFFFFSKRLTCMTDIYLPEDLIEIDSDTPKGHKGQVASHKRGSANLEQDSDEVDDNQHQPLRRTGHCISFVFSKRLTHKT